MHKLHPSTFEVPSSFELSLIKPGDFVKICVNEVERFWLHVTERTGDDITGRVDNDLIYTDKHGIKYNDILKVKTHHVYSVMLNK